MMNNNAFASPPDMGLANNSNHGGNTSNRRMMMQQSYDKVGEEEDFN